MLERVWSKGTPPTLLVGCKWYGKQYEGPFTNLK